MKSPYDQGWRDAEAGRDNRYLANRDSPFKRGYCNGYRDAQTSGYATPVRVREASPILPPPTPAATLFSKIKGWF